MQMNFINCPAGFFAQKPECETMKKMVTELKDETCTKVYDEKFYIYELFMFLPKQFKEKVVSHLEP
jgi:hypothetical protein